jgi:hypothetical protein
MLKEARQSAHYALRKEERGRILDVKLPPAAYEGYDFKEVEAKLIPDIQDRLFRLLRAFEGKANDYSGTTIRTFVVLYPKLVNNGKEFPIRMHVKSSKRDKETGKIKIVDDYGEFFELIIIDKTLVTLILLDGTDLDDSTLIKKTRDHLRKEDSKYADNPIQIQRTTGYEYKINLKTLMQGEEIGLTKASITQDELKYTVKADYRKGSEFQHKEFGKGKIVGTSAGVKGEPGAGGRLDWIDVDFGKIYIKGGKAETIRRIPNVYTKAYWLAKTTSESSTLSEVKIGPSYINRKQTFLDSLQIDTPPATYEGYSWDEVEPRLLTAVKGRLADTLKILEANKKPMSSPKNRIFVILQATAVREGKTYPISIAGDTGGPQEVGQVVLAIANRGKLTSILLYSGPDLSETNLIAAAANHVKAVDPSQSKDPFVVVPISNYNYRVEMNQLLASLNIGLKQGGVVKQDLPYKLRTTYRAGGDFYHKKYGKGTIVDTSRGARGEPDIKGKLDWVDVKFDKPVVRSGKAQNIVRIENVYALTYWLDKK